MDDKQNQDPQDQTDSENNAPLSEEELDLLAMILDEERPVHSGL